MLFFTLIYTYSIYQTTDLALADWLIVTDEVVFVPIFLPYVVYTKAVIHLGIGESCE